MPTVASGTRVGLSYIEQPTATQDKAPAGSGVSVDNLEVLNGATNQSILRRSDKGGAWRTDGYAVGQVVTTVGFSTNLIAAVVISAGETDLILTDTGFTMGVEAAAPGQFAYITAVVGITAPDLITRAVGSFITDGYLPGHKVTTRGFTDPADNGTFTVLTVVAGTLTIVETTLVTEVAGAATVVNIAPKRLRATARVVNLEKDLLESEEVRVDRQIADQRHGFNRVVGAPGFELSREAYDDWLRYLAGSAYVTPVITGDPDFTIGVGGTKTATITRATGSYLDDGFRPGDIVTTAGFTNTVNNRQWRVTLVTATILTVFDNFDEAVAEGPEAAATVTFPGRRLDIGTTMFPITLLQDFADSARFRDFIGVVINEGSLTISPEAIVGGTFGLIGISARRFQTIQLSPVAIVAAPQNSPYAAFDGFIFEDAVLQAVVTGLEFSVANNRTLEGVVGSRFSPNVFEGRCIITGTLTTFFQDETFYNAFLDELERTIWTKLVDPVDSTQFLSIVFPRSKYNADTIDPPQEGPTPESLPFQALVKTVEGIGAGVTVNTTMTIQISNA